MNCRTFLVSSFRAVPSLLTMDFRDGPSVLAQFGAGAVSDIIAAGPGSRIGFRSQSDNGEYDYVTRCTLNNASASGAAASVGADGGLEADVSALVGGYAVSRFIIGAVAGPHRRWATPAGADFGFDVTIRAT